MTAVVEVGEVQALPVTIVGSTQDENVSAQLANMSSWFLTGVENPFQILPQVKRRNRAVIMCLTGPGNNSSAVWIGDSNSIQNRWGKTQLVNGGGIYLPSGSNLTLENGRAWFAVPLFGGGACTLNVLDERYGD